MSSLFQDSMKEANSDAKDISNPAYIETLLYTQQVEGRSIALEERQIKPKQYTPNTNRR